MYLFISAYDEAEDDAYRKLEKEKRDRKKEKDKEKPDDRSDVNAKLTNLNCWLPQLCLPALWSSVSVLLTLEVPRFSFPYYHFHYVRATPWKLGNWILVFLHTLYWVTYVSRYALESPVPPADLIVLSPGYRVLPDLTTVPYTPWHTRFALMEAATSDRMFETTLSAPWRKTHHHIMS